MPKQVEPGQEMENDTIQLSKHIQILLRDQIGPRIIFLLHCPNLKCNNTPHIPTPISHALHISMYELFPNKNLNLNKHKSWTAEFSLRYSNLLNIFRKIYLFSVWNPPCRIYLQNLTHDAHTTINFKYGERKISDNLSSERGGGLLHARYLYAIWIRAQDSGNNNQLSLHILYRTEIRGMVTDEFTGIFLTEIVGHPLNLSCEVLA